MVIDSFGDFVRQGDQVYDCPSGMTCRAVGYEDSLPYGAPSWVRDLIGGSAYTLTSIFGKYQRPRQDFGVQIGQYMPMILLGGAAILAISFLKR